MPKVSVPKRHGDEITITRNSVSTRYKVTEGEVTVKEADLDRFLHVIDGSKEVSGSSSGSTKKE